MAVILDKKFKNDLNPRKAIGFSFPINGEAVFNKTFLTKDQIKANLINFILTNNGERVFNGGYGLNLRARLFEGITSGDTENITEDLSLTISNRFPQIIVEEISTTPYPDSNVISLFVKYQILNFGVQDQLIINLV